MLKQKNLCWQISSLTRFYKQRVKLADCDSSETRQQFSVVNGRLHLKEETRICVGYEEYNLSDDGVAMTTQDCYPTAFSNGPCSTGLVNGDSQSIKLFGDSNICLFKKYSGYNVGDEVWVKTCDAMNANANKAGKYRWMYNANSGLIVNQGSLASDASQFMCLKIVSTSRLYKQRVKIGICDGSDVLQQFDFVNGRIYARGNTRLCAGFEFNKFAVSGEATGSPLILSTCYPNSWAVGMSNL